MKKNFVIIIAIGMLLLPTAGCGILPAANDTRSPAANNASAPSAGETPSMTESDNGSGDSVSSLTATTSAVAPVQVPVSDDDKDATWDDATATKIMFGASASVSGEGAEVKDGVVTISMAGTYVVSGTTADGQIVVNATNKDEVQIVLNGAQITNKKGAAIYAPQCDNLKITLADGTENIVTDGGSAFTYGEFAEEEPNAAIFSKDSLTLNGTGSLTVNAGFNNGIGTKDDLVVVSGNYTIHAANHGLRGNDSVAVLDGDFAITAGNDGIRTSNEEDPALGTIDLRGGTFKINAARDGIQSANGILISGGIFEINTGETVAKVSEVSASAATDSDAGSYKGIKARGIMEISKGEFTVNSADDSIHSNADISILGGSFTLASGDDGIHADNVLSVSSGNIDITKSYEGLEGLVVNISGGTIQVISTDDGINAAGGMNAGIGGGSYGDDRFSGSSAAGITISGGEVTLYTTSDGIDSNGTLDVSGGTVAIFIGTTRDGDATDVDSSGTIEPALYGTGDIAAGTKLAVEGLWSATLASNATSYCLMIPGVIDGQSYKITANGSEIATVTAVTTIQGMMGGGNAGGMGGKHGGDRHRIQT